MLCTCFRTAKTKADIAVVDPVEVAAATTQTDEDDVAVRQLKLFRAGFRHLIYQLLILAVDLKRGSLIERLAAKDILSTGERQQIKEQKKTETKLNSLMMILRDKSAGQFESFLATLGETGQQSVVELVRFGLRAIGQPGLNPLHIFNGKMTA